MDERGLGKRLQQARQAAGLTQQVLCHKANLSYSTLAKIERGAIRSPSIFTIQGIAEALGVSLDVLLGTVSGVPRPAIKTKSGVGFIYFDINGCLVRFFQQAFSHLAEISGFPADIIESTYWHYNNEVCRGSMALEEFNKILAKRFNLQKVDWQQYYFEAIEPIKPMCDLLVWASERYPVGLLSNTMPGFISKMRQGGMIPDISYTIIIDSSEIGSIKPEPKIFEMATDKTNFQPNQILLIDDSRANLIAAEKLGWHVLWFDDNQIEESTAHLRDALVPAEA